MTMTGTFGSEEQPGSSECYTKPNFAKELTTCLNNYRKNKTLCDVILVVNEREYFAHRNILCAASPFFLEKLESADGGKTFGSRLELTNIISKEVFEDVLNFIYIGEICVGEENVRKLISASDVLHMTTLKELACRFYEKRLCPSNCLSIAALANEFNCETLRIVADRFILQNFLDVSRFDEFKLLTCPHIVKIITSDDIIVEREEQIFASAMEWIYCDIHARKNYLATLFKCIRLPFTSKYFISDILEKNEDLVADEICSQLIHEAKSYLNFPDRRHIYKHRREFMPRAYSSVTDIMITCGGNQERMCSNEVLCYVPSQDFWYPLAPLMNSRFLSATVVMNNEIYCIGGKVEGKPTHKIERYNFAIDKWTEAVSLPEPRANHVACVYNGQIYVIGGGENETSSSDVYRFVNEKGMWEKVQNMKVPRRNAAVATHELLYVIGGYGADGQPLSSVERYDPYANEWSKMFPMNSNRASASAICVGNNIFVFGGEYAMWSYYRTAEVFNILTDEWKSIKDMSASRAFMGISYMEHKIYLVGGMVSADGTDQYGVEYDEEDFVDVNETNIVEYYDIFSNNWSKSFSLPVATAGANCVNMTSSKQAVMNRCKF